MPGDGDRGDAEDDPSKRRGNRAGIGDVVAEVGAVVDPGDDQVWSIADQAELGEADAVDGVPSVAKPTRPSSKSTSSTLSGERVVMLRAVALRLESGAMTSTSTPSSSTRARRDACSPGAEMPSSLVRRMRIQTRF